MRALRRSGRGFLAVLTGLLWGTLVLFPRPAPAQTPAGTVIPNAASADFVAGATGYAVSSNPTAATVDAVAGVVITPPRSGVVVPGGSVSYRHTVFNSGNVPDTFDIVGSSPLGFTVAFYASDNATLLADTNGNGIPDTGPVPADGSVEIVVRITAPPGVPPGASDNTTTRATSANSPASIASVVDVTAVPDLWDPLVKTVDPPGQVTPGTVVTYTNTFGNAMGVAATNVAITDVLDSHLVYLPGSATLPPGIPGAAAAYDPATRTVTWTLPAVPAGYTGQVRFRATIDPATPSDTAVSNGIALVSDQSPAPQASNVVTSAVVEQPLRITKTAGRPTAEIGDFVSYTVRVENASALLAVDNVTVVDALPHGFRYVRESTTIDNAAAADPAGGTRPVFALGLLSPGASRTIAYRAVVSVDAPLGDGINAAVAAGVTPGGNRVAAGPARVKVLVREGVLNSKAIVLGRVFVDRDGDRMPGDGDPGVPGVRIYLEDGTYAVTDREGKYSIDGIAPGEHVLKLDRTTLPPGLSPVPLTNAFAGDGGSRFVSVPFGGPARGDFGLAGEFREAGPATPAPGAPSGKVFTFDAGAPAPQPAPLEVLVQGMPATPEILSPANGTALARRWTDVAVRVPEGADHALKVNGQVVPRKRIGKTIHESARKLFVYVYVGVPLEAGPNAVVLEVRPPGGAGTTREAAVSAPGPPARVVLDPARATVRAGAGAPVTFTVTLLDRWGRPSPDEAVVTVVAGKATVAGSDPDPAPGFQVRVQGGSARFDLLPANEAGRDTVRVVLGSALEAQADVYFTPGTREWIVAGVGSARAGVRSASGDTSRVRDQDAFKDGAYDEERLAVFAKGTVLGQYLFTGAYDTGKPKTEGLFERRTGPDKYYPLYGDESVTGYDAESRRKLYLKVERDRSSVLFGDFHTGLTAAEFARYDRAFNGLSADIDSGAVAVKAFATETDQVIVKDEIPGNGTSGYFFLSRTPVVANSDKVRIEVRDRYHPEIVVATTPKTPFVDYTLDPDTGALLFKEPVPTLDPALNPVTIVAVYEAASGGDAFHTYGGRAGVRLGGRAEAGVTAVVEEKGVATDTLTGADAAIRVAEGVQLKGEFARSDTMAAGTGDAWKVELDGSSARGLKYGAYYRDVDAAFSNPSMSGNETGTTKYGAKAAYETPGGSSLGVESFVQENHLNGTKLAQHGVSGKSRFGRATLEGGYRFLDGTVATPVPVDATSHLVHAGVSGPLAKNLEGSIRREQVLSPGELPGYPTRTEAGLAYRLSETVTAHLTQELQESGEKRNATVFGLESRVTESTTLTSRYSVEDAISGRRAQASIGLNNRWQPRRGLAVSTRAERIQLLDGVTAAPGSGAPLAGESATALAAAAEYVPDNSYKATGRYEIRLGDVETTNLFSLGAAVRLADGLSILPKMTFWNRSAPHASETLYDGLVGLAWRPKGAPSVTLLDTLRYKVDRSSSAPASRNGDSLITSTEATWRVSPRWTLLGKYAGKYSRESGGGIRSSAYSDLVMAGVACDLTDRWDVGAQARLMNQYDAKVHSLGLLARTGYRIYRNLYGGVGYNLSRLDDRDLSGAGYKSHGPFVELRFKFDEETLGLSGRGGTGAAPAPAPPVTPMPAAPTGARAPDPAPVTSAATAAAARYRVSGAFAPEPIEVAGTVGSPEVRVQGARLPVPAVDATLADDDLRVRNGRLEEPARFTIARASQAPIVSYRLVVRDARGGPVRVIAGAGAPPAEIAWDGTSDGGTTVAPGAYDYRVEVTGAAGTGFASPRRPFVVAKAGRVVLAMTARGFREGSAGCGAEGMRVLGEAARVARRYPGGTISVAGHTDSAGAGDANLALSLRRARAAASYLAAATGIPRDRIEVRGYGGRRPVAGNETPEGRDLNRRVEIRGEFREAPPAAPVSAPAVPAVTVNGLGLAIDPGGRFAARLSGEPERLALDVVTPKGSSAQASVPVPRVEVVIPDNTVVTPEPSGAVRLRLSGRTDPGAEVVFRGEARPAAADGSFSLEVELLPGQNALDLSVRHPAGVARVVRANVDVAPLPAAGGAK